MGVKEDLVELKAKLSRLHEEPEKFKAALAGAVVVLGMLLVKMPLSARLHGKQAELKEAQRVAEVAERVGTLRHQVDLLGDRLAVPADLSDWQDYITKMVNASGANLSRQEAGKLDGIYDFKKVSISLTITGSYRQVWAFIDGIERGPRLARLENVDLSVEENTLTLRCMFLGLWRPGGGGPSDEEVGDAG